MALPSRFSHDSNQTPLLNDTVDGVVNHEGCPVLRSKTGGWRSAGFIISVEVGERFACYGIESNLINYLTGPLGESVAAAAATVNVWAGTVSLLPLLGAFIADSFLGRYRSIVVASLLYILGLGLLTVSPIIGDSKIQVIVFFFSLYLVAVGQSGHKPCVQAFGADQFDGNDVEESKARSLFFNWWYFGICASSLVTIAVLSYVQDNISWALGFGIPCIVMFISLVVFLLGTKTYRYSIKLEEKSVYARIGRVFGAAFRNRAAKPSAIAAEVESRGILSHQSYEQFTFLNKALVASDGLNEDGTSCSMVEVEEAKAVLRLLPIWLTSLAFGIVYAQVPTFFTKQGATMDRSIISGFDIPPASLQSFIPLAILIFLQVYMWLFVPITRAFTGNPSGITVLQRIGNGMFVSTVSMVIAALVELKRLQTAQEHDLVDKPGVTVPMSVWWMVHQYVLHGISYVFTMVGLQEFFYDQMPTELRSIGLALYHCIFGVGNFISSFLISIIEKATSGNGRDSWFSNNLNRAHLDYYYWLLASLNATTIVVFLYFARCYIYNRKGLA